MRVASTHQPKRMQKSHTKRAPRTRRRRKNRVGGVQSPLSGSEPHYDPTVWNNNPAIQKSHNCYAYAMGQISPDAVSACTTTLGVNTPMNPASREATRGLSLGEQAPATSTTAHKRCPTPQPGHSSGFPRIRDVKGKTCHDIRRRTMTDNMGVSDTTFGDVCPAGTSKIALAVDPAHDYHYYRQDADGLWSHKPGRDPVTNRDADGNLIVDPRTAKRDNRKKGTNLNYKRFCGFMCVPRGHTLSLSSGGRRTAHQTRRRTRRTPAFTQRVKVASRGPRTQARDVPQHVK